MYILKRMIMSMVKTIRRVVVLVAMASVVLCAAAKTPDYTKTKFAWGAEAGGSIDMSANDMSSLNFASYFGLKRSWVKFLGVGAGIDIMVSNSARSFPVFMDFKTNFRSGQSLLFMDLRGGISLNYLPNDYQQNGAYAFGGLGINLAQSANFSSHLIIGYTFREYRTMITRMGQSVDLSSIHTATVKLAVTF